MIENIDLFVVWTIAAHTDIVVCFYFISDEVVYRSYRLYHYIQTFWVSYKILSTLLGTKANY